jgi:hypothetical protein
MLCILFDGLPCLGSFLHFALLFHYQNIRKTTESNVLSLDYVTKSIVHVVCCIEVIKLVPQLYILEQQQTLNEHESSA